MTASRFARWLGLLSLAALVAGWLSIELAGDRLWWTVALLFGPRWVLALPALGLIPWIFLEFRRAVIPTIAGFAIAIFGLAGFHVGLHRASVDSGVPFRVLELNAEGGSGAARDARIFAEFRAEQPDLIVIAECGPELIRALQTVTGYHRPDGDTPGLCMLSRGPILSWQRRDPMDIWRQGGAGFIIRAVVSTPAGPMRVGLVHLATPRHALGNYFDLSELPKQGPLTRANMAQRDEESMLARQWIMQGEALPTVIAGDFNLTVESAIYKQHWGDLRNAFGRAGWGTGYTKHTRRWGVRIDHILTSDDVGTHASFVGKDVGSDHLPLIADLVLPKH